MFVAAAALCGSLMIHLPAWVSLGLLYERLALGAPAAAWVPDAVEFVLAEAEEPEPAEADRQRRRRVPEPKADRPAPAATPPVAKRPPPRPARPPPARAKQRPRRTPPPSRLAVEQRSADPTVEPPPDSRFIAEQNNRVEEETVARVRNHHRDDEAQQVPSTRAARDALPGDAAEQRSADLRDAPGSDERTPTPAEARERPPDDPPPPSRSPRPASAQAGSAAGGAAGGRMPSPGRAVAQERVMQDANGTFRIRLPSTADQARQGEAARARRGQGRGERGGGLGAGRAGTGRRAGENPFSVSWSTFASLYGENELRQERELYLKQRKSSTRGAARRRRWQRFRAALENFVPNVRPGNQTALNAAASPFAAYLAAMHRRIHRRFAEGFMASPPNTVDETYRQNRDMHTLLEIGIAPDGRVARLGIVETSGNILFDLGAYNSVLDSQPFPATPAAIRSPDGLTYFHWGFYRDNRLCGTFNARSILLANVPAGGRGNGPAQPPRRRSLLDVPTAPRRPSKGAE